ncbi:MAG: glutaredoxin domain-containing protein [Pseudomonadota bacterium]
MLKVYAAKWCPHCRQTTEYLKKNQIEFEYIEIEEQSNDTVQKIIDVNGGDDWVVPTLEYNGKWREGKVYDEKQLIFDLQILGVLA